MDSRRENKSANFIAKRLSPAALQKITRVSEFRKFLMVNQDAIVSASGGFRISWTRFLDLPDVKAQKFRTENGAPISPRLASLIWRQVRRGSNRSCTGPVMSKPIDPVPDRVVMPESSNSLFNYPVVSGSRESVLIDLMNSDPRASGRIPDGAIKIAKMLTREREEK